MYCNQCGSQLQPGYSDCPRCGKVAPGGFPLPPSRLEHHLHTLGILWMIVGGLTLVPAVVLMLLSGVVHFVIPFSERIARDLGPLVLMILGGSFLVVGVGGLMVGWGLMHRQAWTRTVAIVLGILALFHPPLGTALGIYTLWVLLSNQADLEYQRLARAA